jgi:hypothetical protein
VRPDPLPAARHHSGRRHPRLRPRVRRRDSQHPAGDLAWRARLPGGHQSDRPPAGAGVDRPPGRCPGQRRQRHHRRPGGGRQAAGESEAGRRTREGQSQSKIADELYPIVENILDELDRWLSASGPSALQ